MMSLSTGMQIVNHLHENDWNGFHRAAKVLEENALWPLPIQKVADIVESLHVYTPDSKKTRMFLGILCKITWEHEGSDLTDSVKRVLTGLLHLESPLGIHKRGLLLQEMAIKGIRQCILRVSELVPTRAVSNDTLKRLVEEKNDLFQSMAIYCLNLWEEWRGPMRLEMAPLAWVKLSNFSEEKHLRFQNGKIRIATLAILDSSKEKVT